MSAVSDSTDACKFFEYLFEYETKFKDNVGFELVTRQLQWRTEASEWAASAACSHHPTARVGHSRGFYRHIDYMTGTRTTILKR